MKEVIVNECPYCGGKELKEFAVCSYGGVYLDGGGLRGASLFALTCRDCGHVACLYCKNPEKLYPKKERRNN